MTLSAADTFRDSTGEPKTEQNRIAERLRKVYDSGKTRPLSYRLEQLKNLERLINESEKEILDALQADLGKCRFEGYVSELGLLLGEIRHTVKRLPRWMRPKRVRTPLAVQPGRGVIHREPLGVALILGAWNYPFQLTIAPLIGAIAGGNCAVLKPSEIAENTSKLIADLLPRFLDSAAYAVVEGGIPETTQLLEQRFDHIFYTGNGTVGRIIMTAAAKHLTPVTLELGGKSPCIVDRDIDLACAARRVAWGKFFNAGQTCVAPDYLLVHQAVLDDFLQELSKTLTEFYGTDPKRSGDYGRIINHRHFDRLEKLISSGTVVVGGDTDRDDKYIAPTVLKDVKVDEPLMADEIFGPLLPVLPISGIEEAIEFVNSRDKPLALYVFTKDRDIAERVIAHTSSGGGVYQ